MTWILPTTKLQISAADVPPGPPKLHVVVDTEEEFDWSAEPSRSSTSVKHMNFLWRFQEICRKYNIEPCYVIDYAIASQSSSSSVLKKWHDAGECSIGAHLHPWVNPPFTEQLSVGNMYPGNLDKQVEYEKLRTLRDLIQHVFNFKPIIYKAGRYGFGPNTADILNDLGFEIDMSFYPSFDLSNDGGPDHRHIPFGPFYIHGNRGKLLSLPVSSAIVGMYPKAFEWGRSLEKYKVPALLSRLHIADRLALSPEGFTSEEHLKLTKRMLGKGESIFNLSLHSSSVMPGGSPYVQSEADVDAILSSCDRFFSFFINTLKGTPTTPERIQNALVPLS